MNNLLHPFSKGNFNLKNHIVMAPMTRSRAIDNIPNDLMATYYAQRSGAGLIVTEGTSPSVNGLGYCTIPGIFSKEQIEGWKKTTDAVHQNDSKIFVQLMHTGRVAHEANLPEGGKVVGVSDIKAAGEMYTDVLGMQEHTQPVALSTEEVYQVMNEYISGAKNAVEAGFDGVELHAANGYLLEQFLNPNVNNRTDEFGGSVENRAKFLIETAQKIADEIGKEKVGIRFSPFSTFNDMPTYSEEEVIKTYSYLAAELNTIGITYLHLSYSPQIPESLMNALRANFEGTIILCNGLTAETAEKALEQGFADLVAFGRYYIANPDFDKRLEKGTPLNDLDFNTFYTPGAEGFTDYPFLNSEK